MEKERISSTQLVVLLIWTTLGTGIVTIPYVLGLFTVRDGWISTLLSSAGGLLVTAVAWLYIRMLEMRRLTEALLRTFGPVVGRALGLWVVFWIWISNCTVLRELELFVGNTILPRTPEYVIGFLASTTFAYAVYMGVEVLARTGEFILPLSAVVGPVLIMLSLQYMDIHEMMPVLADGWSPVLRGAVVPALAYGMEFGIVLQYLHAVNHRQSVLGSLVMSTGLVSVVLTIVVAITVGVTGHSVSYLNYPVLEMVRTIRVGRFLERIDTLYVMAVMSTIFIKLGAFHYAWCEGMKDIFGLSSHRTLAVPGALSVWAGSLAVFAKAGTVEHFIITDVPSYFVFTVLVIPAVTALAAWWKQRRTHRGAPRRNVA
ncbi:GerAB/ArcD/ProY family transporter [Alicyclobacillus contaminans]|uniref:GerAB/ArcD/ProY family transporter n=1 Tax=Alicyclobacillus contaminans TaxID=392016 RepID=UPI000402DB12|nr:endospore germination permease [Alicyclobacillus contaminans]